jgi:hypothetical protein
LRGIVAESLRPVLEPEELDRIPLPSDEAKLFELLCLVRIARCIAPPPHELRWISADVAGNTISLDGTRVYYQQSLDRERVLATYKDEGALRPAVDLFHLRVPRFVDLAFEFETNRAGFDGIIIEAKSGSQQYENTLPQLRTYRAARTRAPGHRYLIWGIVENPDRPDISHEGLRRLLVDANQSADAWVFSSANAISLVLRAVFNTPDPGAGQRRELLT